MKFKTRDFKIYLFMGNCLKTSNYFYHASDFISHQKNNYLERGTNNVYIGQLKQGIPYGKGMVVCDDYHHYGYYRNGKMHGKGITYYTDGSIFSGTWINDYISGKGIYIMHGGDKLLGTFYKGYLYGHGKHLNRHNELVFEGIFSRSLYQYGNLYIEGDLYYSGSWYPHHDNNISYFHGIGKIYDKWGELIKEGFFEFNELLQERSKFYDLNCTRFK